jgi:hypothetical protein
MLNHALAILVLVVYAVEVYRTVQRFGVRRRGVVGGVAGAPRMHMLMAVVMAVVFLTVATSLAAVPFYVGPAGVVINLVYLVLAVRYARRRKQ